MGSWLDYAPVVIAALAIGFSVAFGLSNRRTAMRALALSERQEARRDSRVDLYLNHSMSWRRPSNDDRLLGFHLLIANPTDRASSIVTAELHLSYSLNGIVTTVKVPRALDMTPSEIPPEVNPIVLPARLEANDAVLGWFLFQVKDGLTGGRSIDRYEVFVRDVHGIEEDRLS